MNSTPLGPSHTPLPDNISPWHYQLRLFNIDLHDRQSYEGSVAIDIIIASPTQTVRLHAIHLDITSASFLPGHNDVDPSEPINVIHDHQAQTISVIAPTTLSAGHVRLRLRFRGKINDEPRGFYRVPPVPTTDGVTSEDTQNGPSRILSTRFDPRDARMVFPCFDEPHMKSTFDVEIEVPDGLTVSGNTPIKDTHDIERSGEQRKIISLERSALISTNLLGWSIGPETHIRRRIDSLQ